MAAPAPVVVHVVRVGVTGAEEMQEDLWDATQEGLSMPHSVLELHLSPASQLPTYNLLHLPALRLLNAPQQIHLSGIALPSSVTSINLDRCPIRDLAFLRSLTALLHLSLSTTRIESLAGLEPLRSLSTVRTLHLQPTPSGDPFLHLGTPLSSPVCTTPFYRAYVIHHLLPALLHLDGISSDRLRAASEFTQHFQTRASDYPSRPTPCSHAPLSFPALLATRSQGGNSSAFRRCAASMKATYVVGQPSSRAPALRRITDPMAALHPRQFEYHPLLADRMVVGSATGELTVINPETGACLASVSARHGHALLGLSWLRQASHSHLCVAGADDGTVALWQVTGVGQQMKRVIDFPPFSQLTSLNVNASDERCVASGYSEDVLLYDLNTGRQVARFDHAHQRHINVLKFAHHNPNLFATSSFDHTVKLWDLRVPYVADSPIWTARGDAGLGFVMVCFSSDDRHLLASGVDNDVRLLDVNDGRTSLRFPIKKRNSRANFTRSYFLNQRDYIITGSCEESTVKLFCAHTGRFFRAVEFAQFATTSSVYCQSLRGDPHRDFHFSVLLCETPPTRSPSVVSASLLDACTSSATQP